MKDFDTWNDKKKEIENKGERRYYHPRDIWWCRFGINIGFEQDGRSEDFLRPVLMLVSFSKETCLVAPLSTSNYKHKYRINIGFVTGKQASVIVSQIRVIDTKRLVNRITILDKNVFESIRKSIKDLL